MSNTGSNEYAISEETLVEYVELTYLSKNEIHRCVHTFDSYIWKHVNEF